MIRILFASALLSFSALAQAQAPQSQGAAPPKALPQALPQAPQQAEPKRILFIGNSLTFVTDIPGRLANLCKMMGKTVTVDSVTGPGFSLEDHWLDGRAMEAIRKGWDIVVLQQGTSTQDDARAQLIDYTKRFSGPIRAAGARPALYEVWPTSDRPKEFGLVIDSYRAAAKTVDGIVLPVGEAWLRVLSKDKRAKLYSDAIHPSSLGSDLAVLTIYLSLFPAGPTEFTEEYIEKIARTLDIAPSRRDLWFDAATRAIDEPMAVNVK
jgi:hypothetical protein